MLRRTFTVVIASVLLASSANAGQKADPGVLVIVDAQRGALLRWNLPRGPLNGFQIERSVDGGAAQVLGVVKPGATALSEDKKAPVQNYVTAAADPSTPKEALRQSHLGMELVSLVDPSIAAALALSFEDRNVRSGSTVAYTVRTLTASGQPGAIYAVSVPTPIVAMPPPAPPSGLAATVARTGVSLTWDTPPENDRNPAVAVAYEIKRVDGGRPVALTTSPLLRISSGNNEGPGFVDPKPAVETTARYTVNAVDMAGRRGPDSAPVEIFVPDFTALDGPTAIKMANAPNAVTVSWTAPANKNRKGWMILRSQRSEGGGDLLTPQPLPGSSFIDKSGSAGSTYYYRITAVNQRDEEGLPRISQAVVFRGSAPPPPTALSATLKTGRVVLKWTAPPANLAGYQIERSIGGKDWTILNPNVNAEPMYDDIYPSDAEGTFRYRVISWSLDDLKSAPSEVLDVRLPDTNPPLRPVINSISGAEGKVTLRFSPAGGPSDATGFYILRSLTPKTPGEIQNDTPLIASARDYTDNAVEAGVLYVYRVFAVDRAGNRSDPSDPASVQVGEPELPVPPLPRAHYESKPFPRVVFEFPASPNASVRYALERQDAAGQWMLIQGPFPQETSSVMDAHPTLHTKATYRLVTLGSNGASGPRSAEVKIDVP